MHSGVYTITNIINKKCYVGSSAKIERRWKQHIWSFRQNKVRCPRIERAVRKYGLENFVFDLLEECEPIKETLLTREQHYIDVLKPEYNVLPIAGSSLGRKLTLEQLRNHSEIRKGQVPWNVGIAPSQECRIKLSLANKGKNAGMKPWNTGTTGLIKHTIESIRKIIEAQKGKSRGPSGPRSQETKDKISKAQKGIERPHARGNIPTSSKSRLYCIGYRADSNKWMVRINDKKYGQFDTVEEAVVRRDEVLALIRLGQEPPEQQMKFSDAPNVQNTSGHRGVTWNKNRNKWFVQYTRDNIKYNIGFFDDKDVGAAAYEKARNTPIDELPKAQKRDPDSKGISFDKARGKWMARVADKTLGRFTTREDASEALQTYRMKLHSPDI